MQAYRFESVIKLEATFLLDAGDFVFIAIDLEGLMKSASHEVFSTMLNATVKFETPQGAFFNGEEHIAGTMGFTGAYSGMIYFYSTASFATCITRILLGPDPKEAAAEELVNDAIGELTNMLGRAY